MRGFASLQADHPENRFVREAGDICGRQILGDKNSWLRQVRDFPPPHSQGFQDAMSHVFDIGCALPHVFVFQALIGVCHGLIRPLPGLGGIFMIIFNGPLRGFEECGVLEDERLRPKNFRFLLPKGLP